MARDNDIRRLDGTIQRRILMNISGLWWATDVLNCQKPIPPTPPEKKVEGFQEILDNAIKEVNNDRRYKESIEDNQTNSEDGRS